MATVNSHSHPRISAHGQGAMTTLDGSWLAGGEVHNEILLFQLRDTQYTELCTGGDCMLSQCRLLIEEGTTPLPDGRPSPDAGARCPTQRY